MPQKSNMLSEVPTFKPSHVLACLQTVPLNKTAALAQVDWLQNYTQLQSTLAYLKEPTPEYQLPSVDIFARFHDIKQSINNGRYGNEFVFELALSNLIQGAGDGHFTYRPLLTNSFVFNRSISLTSVSLDGTSLPKIYASGDILAYANSNTTGKVDFFPVTTIDGQDVIQYLRNAKSISDSTPLQDLDARFNKLLLNSASLTHPLFEAQHSFVGQKDSYKIGFSNGTNLTISAQVSIASGATFEVASGHELYQKYLDSGPPPSPVDLIQSAFNSSPTATQAGVSATASATGTNSNSGSLKPIYSTYPSPIVASESYVSGYLLNGSDTKDVAVLVISSFDAEGAGAPAKFQQAVEKFLALCRSQNKKRLIIDIRDNGGGVAMLAYDTFKQLFPGELPYSGLRTRFSAAGNALGEITSLLPTEVSSLVGGLIYDTASFLKTPDGQFYKDWHEYQGGPTQKGDNFTKTASWLFSNWTLNPFFSMNLTDGACSSTCGLFANLLINQGNVTTVTAGGRPNNSTISVIGGTQGGEVGQYETQIRGLVAAALLYQSNLTTLSTAQKAKNAAILYPILQPPPIRYYADGVGPTVNLLDNIAAEEGGTGTGREGVSHCSFGGASRPIVACGICPRTLLGWRIRGRGLREGLKNGGKGLCVNGGLKKKEGGNGATSGGGGGGGTGSPMAPQPTQSTSPSGASSSAASAGRSVGLYGALGVLVACLAAVDVIMRVI
ncbi:uncharacterized protein KY384_001297 [Bacidia gigantensis]|uniref:uncharacterized protein n=1 Tax=Bacidia gigantensis TaxID=2732470 RepID=UPI001D03D868|nr:uncharacterized protein KY384_001297 [Bacidia gigantensis]KAG8533557.1 hypothetical protein KY384_001297 [Bacidia gigantensis]